MTQIGVISGRNLDRSSFAAPYSCARQEQVIMPSAISFAQRLLQMLTLKKCG